MRAPVVTALLLSALQPSVPVWPVSPALLSRSLVSDACRLVTKEEMSAILGAPVTVARPSGAPEKDEDSGGMRSDCAYPAASGAAGYVVVIEFPSPVAAAKAVNEELVKGMFEGDKAKVVVEPGLGDKAWWGETKEGAQLLVLQGAKAFAVGAGGPGMGPPSAKHADLHALAAKAIGRL